jgi:hypothetical protein
LISAWRAAGVFASSASLSTSTTARTRALSWS